MNLNGIETGDPNKNELQSEEILLSEKEDSPREKDFTTREKAFDLNNRYDILDAVDMEKPVQRNNSLSLPTNDEEENSIIEIEPLNNRLSVHLNEVENVIVNLRNGPGTFSFGKEQMNGRTYKAHQKLKSLYDDVKKGLEVDQNEKIYLYCNDKRFSPPLEETFASLYIKFRQKDYFKPKENAYAIYIEYCMEEETI